MMFSKTDSWLKWMDYLELLGADCKGPEYCRSYGDITIEEGLRRAARDREFKMSWVPWVFRKCKERADIVDEKVVLGMIHLMATKRDSCSKSRAKGLFAAFRNDMTPEQLQKLKELRDG